MRTTLITNEKWWNVLLSLVEMITKEGVSINDETLIRQELGRKGFLDEDIIKAVEWFEKAQLSGNIFEILSILEPKTESIRIEHPVERHLISEKLWREILTCHEKGVFSSEITEKLLEGIRIIDTTEWEDDEIKIFINEIISLLKNNDVDNFLKGVGKKKRSEFYC